MDTNINNIVGTILISDGRISEDSAVDLGDIITDEEEIIEELIKRGTLDSFKLIISIKQPGGKH